MKSSRKSPNKVKQKMSSYSWDEFKKFGKNKIFNDNKLTQQTKNKSEVRSPSKAPYNFIPLNDKVVCAEFQSKSDFPSFSTYVHKDDRYTGIINLEITTKTPLFIKGEEKKLNNNEVVPEFFKPGDVIKIPGSSLRGMVRTLIEIASWGKFTQFDDKLLFYRGLADRSSLKEEYEKNMGRRNKKKDKNNGNVVEEEYKFNAGYITKKGLKYYIIPAKQENGKAFTKKYVGEKEIKKNAFKFVKQPDGKYLVYGGVMKGKRNAWLIEPPNESAKKIEIPEIDIECFKNDNSRYKDDKKHDTRDGDIISLLNKGKHELIPCFYVQWKDKEGNQRISFGHTGYFRLAYKKTIGEHVPDYLKDQSIIDIAEAIFGRIESKTNKNNETNFSFASRVFFEDAELISNQKDVFLPVATSRILGTPKPTTFQHYLEQTDGVKTKLNDMKHWNSDETKIRGYKLYWHKENERWQEKADVPKKKVHQDIRPIKANTKFHGKIRFENLSSVELGALLFVLDLPENHYHKIGMGKPLGLGTIEIKSELVLTNRIKRYQSLFQNDDWNLGIEKADKSKFITDFENYVLQQLKIENVKTLWELNRLKELKTMLNWENTKKPNWNQLVNYIDNLKEFRERKVLPTVTEFMKIHKMNG